MKWILVLVLLLLAGCTSEVVEVSYNESCSFDDTLIECKDFKFDEVHAELTLVNQHDYDIIYDSLLIFAAGTCGREFINEEKAVGYVLKKGEEAKLTLVCNALPASNERMETDISLRIYSGENKVLTTVSGDLIAKIG